MQELEIDDYVNDTSTLKARKWHILAAHGIRGYGDWYAELSQISEKYSFSFQLFELHYGRISTLSFLFGRVRTAIAKRLADQINAHFQHHPSADCYDIICHSNGTKVLADACAQINGRFNSVVFLGSVCRVDDSMTLVNICERMANHAGTRDYLPFIAEVIRPSLYEQTGRIGLMNGFTVNRYFNFTHGGGVKADHLERHVIPFLLSGTSYADDSTKPKSGLINTHYVRILGIMTIIIVFISILYALLRTSFW